MFCWERKIHRKEMQLTLQSMHASIDCDEIVKYLFFLLVREHSLSTFRLDGDGEKKRRTIMINEELIERDVWYM